MHVYTLICLIILCITAGDVFLADRGFTCDEYACMTMAETKTPPFTKGINNWKESKFDWSRELSVVRIHVEHVIGIIKQEHYINISNPKPQELKSTIEKL